MIDVDIPLRPPRRRVLHWWELAALAAVLVVILAVWLSGGSGTGRPGYAPPDAVSGCIDGQASPSWYGNDTPDEFASQIDGCLVVGNVNYTATSRYAECINRVTNAEAATVLAEEDALAYCWPAWPLPAWLNGDLTR